MKPVSLNRDGSIDFLQLGRIPWRESVRAMLQLLEIVGQLHRQGIVHGNINAVNTRIGKDGAAQLVRPDEEVEETFVVGQTTPSPATVCFYAAPETLTLRRDAQTGKTSDIYSLGVVFYRLLCGREPFRSQDRQELIREITEDAPQPPRQLVHTIPSQLEAICLRMLAKDAADRFPSTEAVSSSIKVAMEELEDSIQSSDVSFAKRRPQVADGSEEYRGYIIVQWSFSSAVEGPRLQSALNGQVKRVFEQRSAQAIDWGHPEQLFRVSKRPRETLTALALGGGLISLDAVRKALPENGPVAAGPVHVRIQTAELTSHDANSDHGDEAPAPNELPPRVTRLEAVITADRITISHRNLESVCRWFECDLDDNDHEGEGSRRLLVHQLTEGPISLRVAAAERPPRFVGRESQLAILRDRWVQACEGMGQLVLVIGKEGMGKSRLIAELCRGAQELIDDRMVHIQWNCRPIYQGIRLQPAISHLRNRLRLSDQQSTEERRQQLAMHLDTQESASSEMMAGLSSLLGIDDPSGLPPLRSSQKRHREQTAVLQWLQTMASRAPTLFVVEDLQWGDPTTLELLEGVLEQGFNHQLLTVLSFRPEYETHWGSRAHQTQVALNRFTKRHVSAMLADLGLRVDDTMVTAAMDSTKGVPLLVEEFARDVLMQGAC